MIRRGRRGVAALEFALCALPLLALLTLAVEAGWQLAINAALENGARRASRLGLTGSMPAGGTREQAITRAVLEAAPILQAGRLEVTLRAYPGFAALSQPGAGQAGAGAAGQVVEYRLTYQQPVLGPLARAFWGATVEHAAVTLVQNEAFPSP